MPASALHDAFAALCRTLEARTGIGGIAIFAADDAACALRFAAAPYLALCQGEVIPPAVTVARLEAPPLRVEAGELGLAAADCLLQPILDPAGAADQVPRGFIALAAPRTRRIGPRVAAALRDAAEIAGLLLEQGPPPALAPPVGEPASSGWVPAAAVAVAPGPAEALPGASLPRLEVHRLVASLLRARGRGRQLAFALVDIDRFRAVNEGLGTDAGDAILAATGLRVEACLGAEDRLIRLGGDRFLIVTSPGRRPRGQDVRDLADAVLAAVARPLELADRRLSMRASVGVVLAGRAESSPVRLLMQADGAVRRAKAEGGGRVEIHEPGLHAALIERSRIELDLRHALENGELGLVYQPYVALATGEASGVEALLRWRHPTRGDIAPATFIPLAEATGLILPIGIWALRTACRAAASWPGAFTLSVNISALQFHALGFVAEVEAAIADSGFPAERLELEITETVLMRDNPDTIAQLRALAKLGIRIALDDFGTGYSALAYLSRLPHHRIKLDKSFVQDIARPSTAGLIRAIIALARAGGIETTAEGVERPDQLEAVAALGFTHAQGYATGFPVEDPTPLCRAAPSV
jgi:diguanylate cyclase (GGDEF)-like protein